MDKKAATLYLENGIEFKGYTFGYDGLADGEVGGGTQGKAHGSKRS